MTPTTTDKILILDFGSQYTQLIARRIRELNVYCEILPYDCDKHTLKAVAPKGVILSGGPDSCFDDTSPSIPDIIFDWQLPVLAICYGMQALVLALGGEVIKGEQGEYGRTDIHLVDDHPLLADCSSSSDSSAKPVLQVWMSHSDRVISPPPSYQVLARSDNQVIAAIAAEDKPIFGLQFHPEVTHTPQGMEILRRFVIDYCQVSANWTMAHIRQKSVEDIAARVGQEQVLLGLSGGVDSTVVAALLHSAIGDRLRCVFVDTGLLRYREAEQVQTMFKQHLGDALISIDAKQRFLTALQGIEEPEQKRKIIGKTFIDVFQAEAARLQGIKFLAQGTIYPDVIESAHQGKSAVIKSHHNVGGLPQDHGFTLIEPIRQLFKDEVRQLGLMLGLPHEMVYRHPFPGPGLGVRILGSIKAEYISLLQQADHIFIESLRQHALYDRVSQAFAVFLPVKSVGVIGDMRHYGYVIGLRAVETTDFMTAHWADLPHDFLAEVSHRIVNEVKGISRVVYDISGKPPATIEWE